MSFEIIFRPRAQRCLLHLRDRKLKRRLMDATHKLSIDPRPPQCKKMQGMNNTYRIRVSDYRVIYEVNDGKITVLVLAIGHRKEIYD